MFKSNNEAVTYGSKTNSIAWVEKAIGVLNFKLKKLREKKEEDRTLNDWDKIIKATINLQFCHEARIEFFSN